MADKNYSLFMHDNSDSDYGKEAMLDYQLSWIMRVAASKEIQEKNNVLFERCKKVLLKLIGKSGCDNVEIVSVEVWKQWQRIDVTAHVVVKCDGKEEKHLVVIEDKAYTKIHDDQLNRYEETINETYDKDNRFKDFKKHFWVITFAVMINRNGYDDYVVFDDECSYDSYVYEWYRAFIVAKYLVEKNIELSCKQIENYLKYSYCLPDCLNESNEVSDDIKRTILNAYYDIQDKELYEPERSYGFHDYRTVQVARLENKKINIPIGTLVVGNLVGYGFSRWWEE
ncbi:MAG: PD-(D/E)XK nuclease family protein [Bacteroidales bacterium]|nr:PD-(D/E)XK nuclease family protein [Bacteroidales bacterium]